LFVLSFREDDSGGFLSNLHCTSNAEKPQYIGQIFKKNCNISTSLAFRFFEKRLMIANLFPQRVAGAGRLRPVFF